MFLRFEENPNSGFNEDRVCNVHGEARRVTHVLRLRYGHEVWCPIIGMQGPGQFVPAMGIKVEDSGDAMCWLVYGGLWGIRMAPPADQVTWSLDNPDQWGDGFLLLPSSGVDLRFDKLPL